MHSETRWRGTQPHHSVEPVLAKLTEKLKKKLGQLDPQEGGVDLQVNIDKHPTRESYEVSANLHAAHHHLFAKEEGQDLSQAVHAVFQELERQAHDLKTKFHASKKATPPMNEVAEMLADEAP